MKLRGVKMNLKNIAVIYGGNSSEREISLMSGKNVAEALESVGHNVDLIDTKYKDQLVKLITNEYDIAFLTLHGRGGEDGAMQGFLETIGLRYTGSKIHASARAMDKADSKAAYDRQELLNAPYFVVKKYKDFNLDCGLEITGDDVVVKAANEGSSIGLYFAQGKDQILECINKAFKHDETVVVEKRIPGREFTCAVLDFPEERAKEASKELEFSGKLAALPPIEIVPKNEFYDFESKYTEGGSEHICPAKISDELATKIKKLAVDAHRCLGCSGYSRTDMRVDDNGEIFLLETNTLPGMTSKSLVPDAARAVGLSFEELCQLIVEYVDENN